jgi:hypothetical protein
MGILPVRSLRDDGYEKIPTDASSFVNLGAQRLC